MPSRIAVTRRRRARQAGSAMVETALTFSAFLLMTFGVMEFAMAVYAYNFVAYAARDAARYASVHGSQCHQPVTAPDLQSYVQQEAVGLVIGNLQVNTTWNPDNNPGSTVAVEVSYNVIPLVGLALQQNMGVSSTSTMMIVH